MTHAGTVQITTPGNREIVMTRVFDAPRRMVFDAFTKPELLKRWLLGPPGWSMPVCEVDLRIGGGYRYLWRNDGDGTTMGMGGVYREIVVPERIVSTERFDDAWYPGEGVGTLVLVEQNRNTTVTHTMRYESREARDAVIKSGMATGVTASYDRLADLLLPGPARSTPASCTANLPINRGEDSVQKIVPFLWFDGKAEEAVNFYVSIFKNSKVVSMSRYGDAGPGPKGTVMGAAFELEGQQFYALNGGPQFKFTPAISLFVNCETQQEVDDLWKKLSAGGREDQCGWLQDRYGLSWQIIPTVLGKMLGDKDAGKAGRAMQAMLKMKKIDINALQQAYDRV